MFNQIETLRYVGRFSLAFALAVLLLGIRYANIGLMSIAAGVAIIGVICISDSIRYSIAARARVPRPSGEVS